MSSIGLVFLQLNCSLYQSNVGRLLESRRLKSCPFKMDTGLFPINSIFLFCVFFKLLLAQRQMRIGGSQESLSE